MPDTKTKSDMHRLLPILVIIVGVVLMIGKIVVDSEPGGIPILLILLGAGWYFILRVRRSFGERF